MATTKKKENVPGLVGFNETSGPSTIRETIYKKGRPPKMGKFGPYVKYIDELGKTNQQLFADTDKRVNAANAALQKQLAAQTEQIRQVGSAELKRLGHGPISGGDYQGQADASTGIQDQNAASQDSIIKSLTAMDAARNSEYRALGPAYKEDLKKEMDPMTGQPGSGFSPMGGAMGWGGGGMGGFSGFAGFGALPSRSDTAQSALNALVNETKPKKESWYFFGPNDFRRMGEGTELFKQGYLRNQREYNQYVKGRSLNKIDKDRKKRGDSYDSTKYKSKKVFNPKGKSEVQKRNAGYSTKYRGIGATK